MFLFQISNYDDPALDSEAEELLRQRLEAHSRQTVPGMWKLTDRMDAHVAKGTGQKKRKARYRVYGVLLLALGVFILALGLMEPRTPALMWAGGFAIFAGVLEFCLARQGNTPKAPAACKKEAKSLLAGRRAIDWAKNPVKVSFDEAGMTICSDGTEQLIPYDKMKRAFETEHLWLLIYHEETALLLQKRDLISGDADKFFPYIIQTIDAER
jgi:hypothetical protein